MLDDSLPEVPVPPQRRHGLLLAVKEALHNILKHSDASLVKLHCQLKGRIFLVTISDNGGGFDPDNQTHSSGRRGHGLENMRRRMEELGGSCVVESRIGRGTQIHFHLPLR
jgi:signal transduction histidine kinase